MRLIVELEKPITAKSCSYDELILPIFIDSVKRIQLDGSASLFAEGFQKNIGISRMHRKVLLDLSNRKNYFLEITSKSEYESPITLKSHLSTEEMFTANSRTGIIRDIYVAFKQFQLRMIEITNQYGQAKKKTF
jgi:hypothetical protein